MGYVKKLVVVVCFALFIFGFLKADGFGTHKMELGSDTNWEYLLGDNQIPGDVVMHADDDYAIVTTEGNTIHLYSFLPDGTINWTESYVMDYSTSHAHLIALSDRGFLIVSNLYEDSRSKLRIIKTLENGESVWMKTIEDEWDNASLICNSLVESPDGEIVLAGNRLIIDEEYFYSPLIIFLSSDGENFTKKSWTAESSLIQSKIAAITTCEDGDYIITGYNDEILLDEEWNKIGNDNDIYIARINAAGEIEWDLTYGGNMSEQAYDIYKTSDGNYAIVADFSAGLEWGPKPGFMKVDSDGNNLSTHIYWGLDIDGLTCIIQTQSGGFAIGGYTESNFTGPMPDSWFVRTGSNGKFLWSRILMPEAEDSDIRSIAECVSGGFVCSILQYDEMFEYHAYIVRIPDNAMDDNWIPPFISHTYTTSTTATIYSDTTEFTFPPANTSSTSIVTSGNSSTVPTNYELLDSSIFIISGSVGVLVLVLFLATRRRRQSYW